MGENEDEKQAQASQVFENFVQATTCKGTLQAFNILTCLLDLDPLDHRNFYTQLKSKVNTWKAKALWHKLDKRGSHKEYKRGKACSNTKTESFRKKDMIFFNMRHDLAWTLYKFLFNSSLPMAPVPIRPS